MITTTYPSDLVTFRHTAGHVLTLPADTDPQALADKLSSFIQTIDSCDDTDAGMHALHRVATALRGQLDTARTNLTEARRQRDELHTELSKVSGGFEARIEARRAMDETLADLRAQRDYWLTAARAARKQRDELAEESVTTTVRNEQQIDGDLLLDIIIEACPEYLTDIACCELAEHAITDLARVDGVTVLRGTHGEPWTPDADAEPVNAPNSDNDPGCNTVVCDTNSVVDASIVGDGWFEWAVFRVGEVDKEPLHLADAPDQADAERLAEAIPGAWIARRRVITEDWRAVG